MISTVSPGTGKQGGKSIVDAVREHDPEPGVERLHALQQIAEAVGVLDVGPVHEDAEQQFVRVHRDVALAPFQPLRRVPAARAAALRGLHALGVDDRRRGTGLPPGALAQHDHEVVADALPHALSEEGAHVAVHGAPGRESRRRRQVPPLAAGAHEIEEAVQQVPQVRAPRPPSRPGGRDQRFQEPELIVRHACPEPKSPTNARSVNVHMAVSSQETACNVARRARISPSRQPRHPSQGH